MRIHYLMEEAEAGLLEAEDDSDFPFLNSASARFAGTYPGDVLKKAGHEVGYHLVNKNTGPRTDIDFKPGDIVLCIRNYFNELVRTADRAKTAGAVIIKQMNDPHILSTDDTLKEVRDSHFSLMEMADGVIACSRNLAGLASQYHPDVAVIHDGVDTLHRAPEFNAQSFREGKRPLEIATACYPHNQADILDSLSSITAFARVSGDVSYTIVTKAPRADQRHHGSDYDRLAAYRPDPALRINLVEYTPQKAAQAISNADIVVIQEDSGNRTGYKKDWYPNKSNGRGAAAINAGKPFFCPGDILSYRPFLNVCGGYNIDGDVGKTLAFIVDREPSAINKDIAQGQAVVESMNSSQQIARQQFDFFAALRAKKGFLDHGTRP